jgi:hypothetical protein
MSGYECEQSIGVQSQLLDCEILTRFGRLPFVGPG